MTRMHINLIDMTSRPDQHHKWILHMQDHFSKFSWTHPLISRHTAEVAEKLFQTFCLFGAPRILYSDNDKELIAGVISEVTKKLPGLALTHEQPRHLQSQGCMEISNGDLQLRLRKWLEEHPENGWVEGLPYITYAMNSAVSAKTAKSPYEVVFWQSPRINFIELKNLADQGFKNEEDSSDFSTKIVTNRNEPELMTEPWSAIGQIAASSITGPSISLQPLNQPEASNSQGNSVKSAKTGEAPARWRRKHDLLPNNKQ